MATLSTQLLAEIVKMMTELAGDWEYDGEITPDTYLFGDLGMESLDLVVLCTAIQERHGRMPFAEFFAELGQRAPKDLSVGEFVAFIDQHQQLAVSNGAR